MFTISNAGSPGSTLQRNGRSRSPQNSPTGVRASNSPADKYKWTEHDTTDSPPEKKSRRRHVLCVIALIVLFLGVCAGLAVILAYKVFKVGGKYLSPIYGTPDGTLLFQYLPEKKMKQKELEKKSKQ